MNLDCLFVYTNLGPHMISWINASARHHRCGVIELAGSQAIYKWDKGHLDPAVLHAVLDPEAELESIDTDMASRKAANLIYDWRPRAVLTCRYDLAIIRKITRAARRSGATTLLMSDSWEGAKTKNPVREVIKRILLRQLYDGAIVAGSLSWSYLRKLGFAADKLWTGIDVVDNAHFQSETEGTEVSTVLAGSHLNHPSDYVLVPCRHASEKNLIRFMHGFSSYRRKGGLWSAVFVGSGPLTADLESLRKDLGLDEAVEFAGWVSYTDLPVYYKQSRAVVLPSISEPWGLVVNEAMAAGKPVLVRTRCGCVPE